MKKVLIFMIMLMPICIWAHTPLLVVEDNGDGTIYIEAGFSNGASAEGVNVIIKLKGDDSVFWTGKMPADYLEVEMPPEPYTVTMDAGPGHIVTKDGPEPEGGFGAKGKKESTEDSEKTVNSSEKPSEAKANTTQVSEATWVPAMTSAAIPAKPPTSLEIIRAITAVVEVIVLAYIAILLKRK